MSWRIHGFYFTGCSADFVFSLNTYGLEQPRAEHNDISVYDLNAYNSLNKNGSCNGQQFHNNVNGVGAKGAIFAGHLYSSRLNIGLATVATDRGPKLFNHTAGLILNEVQYSTLSLRGLGAHADATFNHPDPTRPEMYPGWGVIMVANINSNTIEQLHCEGAGGCVLFAGPGSFENLFTSSVGLQIATKAYAATLQWNRTNTKLHSNPREVE